jgi:hypothetical protein
MESDPVEKIVGIKLLWIIAGFCGGVIALAMDKTLTVGNAFFSVFSGMCAASFLTPVATYSVKAIYDLPQAVEFAVAFLFGLVGLVLARKFYAAVSDLNLGSLIPRFGGGKKDE